MHSIRGRDRDRARPRDRDRDSLLGIGIGIGIWIGIWARARAGARVWATSTIFSFPGMRFRKCVIAFQFPGSPLYVPST